MWKPEDITSDFEVWNGFPVLQGFPDNEPEECDAVTVAPPPRHGCVWYDSEDSDDESEPRVDRVGSYYHLPVGTLAKLKPCDHWVNHRVRAIGRIRDVTNPILYSFEEEGQHEVALDVRNPDQNTKLRVESLLEVYGVVRIDKQTQTLRLCMDFARELGSGNLKEYREAVAGLQLHTACEGCLRERCPFKKPEKRGKFDNDVPEEIRRTKLYWVHY